MAKYSLLTTPWTRQPPSGTPLRKDGIAAGITWACRPGVDNGREIVRGTIPTEAGTAFARDVGADGPCTFQAANQTSNLLWVDGVTGIEGKEAATILAWTTLQPDQGAQNSNIFNKSAGGSAAGAQFQLARNQNDTTSLNIVTDVSGQITANTNSGNQIGYRNINHMVMVGGTYDGAEVALIIDGRVRDTTAGTGAILTASNRDIEFGSYQFSTDYERRHYFAAIWDRVLSPDEVQSLNSNPWQLFEPLRIPVFIPSAAVGGVSYVANPMRNRLQFLMNH